MRYGAYRVILNSDSFRAPRPLPETTKTRVHNGAKTSLKTERRSGPQNVACSGDFMRIFRGAP